ncbi:hypothetical protein ACFLZQ_08150 [Thermodesulfobacteriota bacterium]
MKTPDKTRGKGIVFSYLTLSDISANNEKVIETFLYPIKIGTSWKYKAMTYLLPEKFEIELEGKIDKLDETVITDAGIFENCIKVKYFGEKEVINPNQMTKTLDETNKAKVSIERK